MTHPHPSPLSARPSFLTAASRVTSKRPSIITTFSNGSDRSVPLSRFTSNDPDRRNSLFVDEPDALYSPSFDQTKASGGLKGKNTFERALAYRDSGRQIAMVRTASDGADVAIEEDGNEWEVLNPHGTGKGHHGQEGSEIVRS